MKPALFPLESCSDTRGMEHSRNRVWPRHGEVARAAWFFSLLNGSRGLRHSDPGLLRLIMFSLVIIFSVERQHFAHLAIEVRPKERIRLVARICREK